MTGPSAGLPRGALRAAGLLAGVWCLLGAGRMAAPWAGPGPAALAAFAAAALLVWSVPLRFAPAEPAAPPAPAARRAAATLLGVGAGFALFPAWLRLTWHAGLGLGLAPQALGPPLPPLAGDPALWLCGVVLAPAFEERLYRGHVLGALRALGPAPAAVAGSSALFALPHLLPWSVLGTFLGGLGLGALACAGGGLALCLGVHAGLNVAAVAGGVPPIRLAPAPGVGLCAGLAALGAGLALLRPPAERPAQRRRAPA